MSRVHGRFPRIPCLVPFCGCGATCYPPGFEIICPKHYRLVDRALKAKRRRIRRALRRRGLHNTWRADFLEGALWQRMRSQAIERAAACPA